MKNQTPNTPKATYVAPEVTVISVRVERGFNGSYSHGMTESISDGGCYDLGNPDPYYPNGEPTLEGISNGQTIFF